MSQESTQGIGKVRLIAKKGRSSENVDTGRFRDLAQPRNGASDAENKLRKQYAANLLLNGAGLEDYYVEFENTPEITESGSASYYEMGEVRGPGSILMYMGSPSRSFTISAKLISRNVVEAETNQVYIHRLKSWRQPESYTGGVDAGTPALLHLQGYGKMFKDIPVVMTDLSIEFSSEYDYISTGPSFVTYEQGSDAVVLNKDGSVNGIKTKAKNEAADKDNGGPVVLTASFAASAVPIITSVSITLKEARAVEGNVDGLEGFDILKYRTGTLQSW